MSSCAGLLVVCVAMPLALVVLLVAGVAYLALEGSRLVSNLALGQMDCTGSSLPENVRTITTALNAAGTEITGLENQIATTLPNLRGMTERLQANASCAYQSAMSTLTSNSHLPAPRLEFTTLGHSPISASSLPATASILTNAVLSRKSVGCADSLAAHSALDGAARGQPQACGFPLSNPQVSEVKESAIEALARARAVQSALKSEQALKLVADTHSAAKLQQGEACLLRAEQLMRSGDCQSVIRFSSDAEEFLAVAAHDAHRRLENAQRATMAAAIGNSLEDLGYGVRVARGMNGFALVGRREHQTIALVANNDGRIQMDMAGFEGTTCETEVRQLLVALKDNGLNIRAEELQRHGRFEGGPLIRKAQRTGKPLEEALAQMMGTVSLAHKDNSISSEAAAAPVQRRAKLSGLTGDRQRQMAKAFIWGQAKHIEGV